MKTCSYCGRENQDDAARCSECATEFAASEGVKPQADQDSPVWQFAGVSEAEMSKDFVTLVTCATLPEADLVVNHLEGAGISAFVPDEFSIQNAAFLSLTSGFVRVQVSPADYDSAKEFLTALSKDPDGSPESPA